jgi:hypothetical protein
LLYWFETELPFLICETIIYVRNATVVLSRGIMMTPMLFLVTVTGLLFH